MRNKVRVFVKGWISYGTVLLEDLKDVKPEISVEFHRDKSPKGETPNYELVNIRVIKKSNLK
jgi:hypothetical protein